MQLLFSNNETENQLLRCCRVYKMKIDMAEGDYFNPGMIVACTTCHGQKVEGEVMAFDYQSKVIALSILSSAPYF